MAHVLTLLLAGAVLVVPKVSGGDVPRPHVEGDGHAPHTLPEAGLPIGKWSVEFANGVIEVCEIREDGTAFVVEPLRASGGKAAVKGGSVVIVFEDDRVERWTPVGRRLVVEHWFPGSQLPTATPVLGIAERIQVTQPAEPGAAPERGGTVVFVDRCLTGGRGG